MNLTPAEQRYLNRYAAEQYGGNVNAALAAIIAEHRDRWQDCMTGQRKHIAACRIAHLRYQARQQARRA